MSDQRARQKLYVVNASPLLSDTAVKRKVGPLQTQIDRDFLPAWGTRATPVTLVFARMQDIPAIPYDAWAVFLNRFSDDPGALGWHTDDPNVNVRVYSRVFVADAKRLGLDWGITLGHEILEMLVDPDVRRVWRMPDGRYASLEVADAVESDAQAYVIKGHRMTNFVLPSYFSADSRGPWDFRNALRGPCPTLTAGGYMSIRDSSGQWGQIFADKKDGMPGRRAIGKGFRRSIRATRDPDQLIEIP